MQGGSGEFTPELFEVGTAYRFALKGIRRSEQFTQLTLR